MPIDATDVTFVRDVFKYLRFQHSPASSSRRQRWIEVDLVEPQDKELQAASPLDVVTR